MIEFRFQEILMHNCQLDAGGVDGNSAGDDLVNDGDGDAGPAGRKNHNQIYHPSRPILAYRYRMTGFRRNNVQASGRGATPTIFAHGYRCEQHMWRMSAPAEITAGMHEFLIADKFPRQAKS